jgi:hypothetical protein
MTIQFTLSSRHQPLLTLVRDFAHGLGYEVTATGRDEVRFPVPDGAEMLLHVLTHVALAAARSDIEMNDAVCTVDYHEPRAAAAVRLKLRLADIALQTPS